MSKIYLICALAGVVIGAVLIIIDMLSHLDSCEYEVDEAPTVDAASVVRCKDCKYYMTIYCPCDGCCISPDWYCADGKRRDNTNGNTKNI